MKKNLLFLFFIPISLLLARENPFFPIDSTSGIPLTTNQVNNIPPLQRATLTLPSTARTIERVTVQYKNLDGSLAKKSIELENSIDWHLPLFISQNYGASPENPKTHKKVHFKKIASLSFIKFYEDAKQLKVLTKDKLLRSFLLVKPHRIVCDFRRQTDMRSYLKSAPKGSLFKKIRIGTHKGYYRVVIELDGYYEYKVKKRKSGYLFMLR